MNSQIFNQICMNPSLLGRVAVSIKHFTCQGKLMIFFRRKRINAQDSWFDPVELFVCWNQKAITEKMADKQYGPSLIIERSLI